MSESKFVHHVAPNCRNPLHDGTGVDLRDLPPLTTLLVQTVNSLYRVVISDGRYVSVQGGDYFPEPTLVYLDGAVGETCMRAGCIALGLKVRIRIGNDYILTTAVRAITTEHVGDAIVH
jgi:hypothetical protein